MLFTCHIIGSILWAMMALIAIVAGMMSPMAFDTEEAAAKGAPKKLVAALVVLFLCCVIAIAMGWIGYGRDGGWLALAWYALPIIPSVEPIRDQSPT